MKKLIVGLIATLMTMGALVATSETASAVPKRCDYTGCIKTVTNVKATSPGRRTIRARFSVRTEAPSNVTPRGFVKIIARGPKTFRRIVRYPARSTVIIKRVPRGRYIVTAKYIPGSNTNFKRSRASDRTRV